MSGSQEENQKNIV